MSKKATFEQARKLLNLRLSTCCESCLHTIGEEVTSDAGIYCPIIKYEVGITDICDEYKRDDEAIKHGGY